MTFCKERFLMIKFILILVFLMSINAQPKRTRDLVEYHDCMFLIEQYCQNTDTSLTAENCAQALVFYWREVDAINSKIKPYHDHLLKNINYRSIDLQSSFCSSLKDYDFSQQIEDVDEIMEAYDIQKCIHDLIKFGDSESNIFEYALKKTNASYEYENYKSNSFMMSMRMNQLSLIRYSVLYMEDIAEKTSVNQYTIKPTEFCELFLQNN